MGRWFFASLDLDQPALEPEESDDVLFDFEPLPPKIKNFGEAIQSLEDVQTFLDSKGYSDQATTIAAAVDLVASLHWKTLYSLLLINISDLASELNYYLRQNQP